MTSLTILVLLIYLYNLPDQIFEPGCVGKEECTDLDEKNERHQNRRDPAQTEIDKWFCPVLRSLFDFVVQVMAARPAEHDGHQETTERHQNAFAEKVKDVEP